MKTLITAGKERFLTVVHMRRHKVKDRGIGACQGVKNIGKPCAGKPHARFDERGQARACSLLYPLMHDPIDALALDAVAWKWEVPSYSVRCLPCGHV